MEARVKRKVELQESVERWMMGVPAEEREREDVASELALL